MRIIDISSLSLKRGADTMKPNKKFGIILEILVITFLVMSVVPVCGLSDSSADISAYPSIVNPGDEITVTFSGAPGFELDRIAMYKVGDPNEEEYDEWQYLEGKKSGTLFFTAPDEPGDYEFRLFEDDGYTDIARSNVVTVVLTSSTILPTVGGLLTVESEDNELNGASLDVPAQAVTNNVTISIATTETLPSGSPFGQVPVGKLFVLLPSNLTFSEPVTLTLPIPAGEERYNLYIGRWDDKNKIWENIGGTIDGDFIATNISHLSFYGVFYTGKSTVQIINKQELDTSDLPITVMYVAGPVPPPDTPDQSHFRATRPLPAGGVQLKQDESRIMQLLPGRYHFLVSYPRPQPGVANSMWFTIPVLTEGADDGQIDQTIAIRDYGADSTNSYTNDSIMFPGRTVVESTNFRPVVNCNAIVPEGVPLLGTNQILNIGPIKIEHLQNEGITLSATVTDPEGSALKYYWTVPTGVSIGCFTSGTTASGSTLTAQFKTRRAGIYTVYLTVYDQYGLFNEGRWIIRVIPNAKPYIDVVVDDVVIDFGRLDSKRRFSRVGPGLPREHPIPFPNVNFPGIPPIPNWGVYGVPPVPDELSASTELKRILIIDDDPHPNITAHFNPSQYPGGMTCVYAIVADADGDAIDAEFVLPTPLFGRGNMYTAIRIPDATNPITSEIKLSDGKTLAESFPDGYPIGAILDNYKVMEAYNAVLTEYANRGWLPLQPHRTGRFVAPTGPRRYTVPDIERNITIVFTTPALGEFPYVIGFNQGGIRNGSINPGDIVMEAPNPLELVPQGTVYDVTLVKGSWTNGDAKGYLWMIPVTNDFWDPRHSITAVPVLFVNNVRKATCSYVGQTLPVIWEAPCDPNIEQTTHDRRHVFDPSTIISRGGTVNIEARVNDPFSPQERAFGLVAFPTPTSMEEEEECDDEHLNLCDSEKECGDAGGYWYNNQCNVNPEEDTSDGEFYCPIPIPNEASHIVEDYEEYWWTPNGFVGPRYTWYDMEKTKKYCFFCYNIEGERHGLAKVWYEDGPLSCEWNYKDGKDHGVCKGWWKDGTPQYERNYKDGKEHGVCKGWYEDGTLDTEDNYKDGKEHGVFKGWWKDGTPQSERNYKDGKEQGVSKSWYADGTLSCEWNNKDGKKHGVSKSWYEDGTPEYEDNYKDGKEHGVCKGWWKDGTPQYERNYKDGKEHGVCKGWWKDGTLKYEDNNKDGKKHGVCKMWSDSGKLISECNYEEDKCVSCVLGRC